MIKVMVIDNQTLFRDGIKVILEETNKYEVVAAFDSGDQAMKAFETNPIDVDVALISLHLRDGEAVSTTNYFKWKYPDIGIIALMEWIDEDLIVNTITAGCDALLLKQHYPEKLIHAIDDVIKGDTVISGPIAAVLAKTIRKFTVDEKGILAARLAHEGFTFTSRELDVLQLLMNGYTNQMISSELNLGDGTVKNYVSELYNKLNIRSRKCVIKYLQDLTN